jgi:hypothetical protein
MTSKEQSGKNTSRLQDSHLQRVVVGTGAKWQLKGPLYTILLRRKDSLNWPTPASRLILLGVFLEPPAGIEPATC